MATDIRLNKLEAIYGPTASNSYHRVHNSNLIRNLFAQNNTWLLLLTGTRNHYFSLQIMKFKMKWDRNQLTCLISFP